jgi:2,5-diketo-D-gluconate reductase A
MQTLPLLSGHAIPQLGFGLWQVADTARITEAALGMGYRLVDGASIYGNEVGMGQGIRAAGLPRDEIFVTSKVWNDDQGYDRALHAVEESLDRLRLDRLDLCLIHWPCAARNLYVDTWRALVFLRDQGAISSIGVSNFNAVQIDRLTDETGVTPVLNQIELHPLLQQASLRAAHASRGMVTQSWTPLGRGLAFDAPEVLAIAARTDRTPAQVILRWHIELGLSVIPRSSRIEGLRQNLETLDFALTPDDLTALATLNRDRRCGPDPDHFG